MRRIIGLRSYLHVGKGENCCRVRRVLDSKNDLYVPDWSYDPGWAGTRCRTGWWRVSGLRPIAAPFVAAAPAGARVRTRLRVSSLDEAVLRTAGSHLGSLAGRDLAARCAGGRLEAKGQAVSRAARKRALTAESSSRWAGAITRTSEDQVRLAGQNLRGQKASLQARIRRVRARLAIPAGGKDARVRGYATPAERHAKALRLQVLQARLARVDRPGLQRGPLRHQPGPGIGPLVPRRVMEDPPGTGAVPGGPATAPRRGPRRQRRAPGRRGPRGRR